MDAEDRERLVRIEVKLTDLCYTVKDLRAYVRERDQHIEDRVVRLSGRVWGLAILWLTTALATAGSLLSILL